jgi:transposase-like protein
MSQTRRVFTTEFKQECVRLVIDQGYGVEQAAKAMSVGLSSMQRWLQQYRQEMRGFTPQAKAISVNACLEVHHSLRAKVHQFKTYF